LWQAAATSTVAITPAAIRRRDARSAEESETSEISELAGAGVVEDTVPGADIVREEIFMIVKW
jgi:hypothetical protein